MKKVIALLLILLLSLCFSVSAFAAGTDDGSISVADVGGKKFFGTQFAEGIIKYEAANGSGENFFDLSGDKTMDICDLVALHNNEVDFDLSGAYTASDSASLRLMLIGAK